MAPHVTIGELDEKKKSGRTKRIRTRAQKTTVQIVDLAEGDGFIRQGVQFEEYHKRPRVDFDELELDKDEKDDVLLATILTYREEHPERDVALVTNDAGPRLKARRLRIPVLPLPDDYLLEPELSNLEKELRKAKAEAARARGAQPDLKLSVSDGSERLILSSPPDPPTDEEIAEKIKEQHRKYSLKDADPAAVVGGVMGMFAAGPEEIERYKRGLPKFLEEWEEWFRTEVEREALKARSFELSLKLVNSGRKPASDTKVELSFPAGTKVTEDPDFLEPEPQPQPPVKPRSSLELLGQSLRVGIPGATGVSYDGVIGRSPTPGFVDVWAPEIRELENHTRVTLQTGKVQQGDAPRVLDPLFITPAEPQSFSIDYKIVCDELHNPVENSLHVIYEEGTEIGE